MNFAVVLLLLLVLGLLLVGPARGFLFGRWDLTLKGRRRSTRRSAERPNSLGGPWSQSDFGEFGGVRN